MTEHRSINAVVESFFGTLKQEIIYDRAMRTSNDTISEVNDYIQRFYNSRRLHSSLGNTSPLDYELASAKTLAQAA